MTEEVEPETSSSALAFYPDAINLFDSTTRRVPNVRHNSSKVLMTSADWMDFLVASRNAPQYVQFTNEGSKRYGAIARTTVSGLTAGSIQKLVQRGDATLNLRWTGRNTNVTLNTRYEDVAWIKGHTGDTQWAWDRSRRPIHVKPVLDRLGRDISVDDFCAYILYHFDGNGAAGIYFGKVTEIERDGTVWLRNIKLNDKDRVDVKRVKDNSLITILTKDLMDKLMLARLSVL